MHKQKYSLLRGKLKSLRYHNSLQKQTKFYIVIKQIKDMMITITLCIL